MSQTKIEQSKSYREFLLENLQDEAHAAGYLEAALLETDGNKAFLQQLLRSAIDDVIEANALNQHAISFDGSDIQVLVELLDAMGFRLAIVPKSIDQ
jgi:DNA-binding phage protein